MIKLMKKKMKNRKGFTLVELVVVIAILGILAAIAVPKLSQSRVNAAIAAHNANVRTLESAATMAIAEGTSPVTWKLDTGKETTESTGELGWENFVQEWPSVSNQLSGKKVKFEEAPETEKEVESAYEVKIGADNNITITPSKIVVGSTVK